MIVLPLPLTSPLIQPPLRTARPFTAAHQSPSSLATHIPMPSFPQFYGQKLFQAQFIKMVVPGATVLQQMLYILLNNGVALVGCESLRINLCWTLHIACSRFHWTIGRELALRALL